MTFVICVAGDRRHAEALIARDRSRCSPARADAVGGEDPHRPHRRGHRLPRLAHQAPPADATAAAHVYTYPSKTVARGRQGEGQGRSRGPATNQTLDQLLHRLNPVLRGWCAYFRSGVVLADLQLPARLHLAAGRRAGCDASTPSATGAGCDAATSPGGGRPTARSVLYNPASGRRPPATATGERRSQRRGKPAGSPDAIPSAARASGEPGCLMATGMPVESRMRGTRTSGSEGGPGKRADPKGRWRAPVRPYWAVLEDRFELLLVNARHVKQVPGRKTDVIGRRSGSASCWRPACCGRASCRRSRSGRCAT